MGFENKAGINVSNYYGARNTGGTRGIVKTEGTYNEFSVAVPLTNTIDFILTIVSITVFIFTVTFYYSTVPERT